MVDRALALVNDRYLRCPTTMDGYSRIGLGVAWARGWKFALEFFERDVAQDRVSWWQMVRYIEGLSRIGNIEKAVDTTESLYDKDAEARNGFASIGWVLYEQKDYLEAQGYFARDINRKRITPGHLINAAVTEAALGEIDNAEKMVCEAYLLNPALKDGYSRIAWIKKEDRPFERNLVLLGKDYEMKRQTPSWTMNYALILSAFGFS